MPLSSLWHYSELLCSLIDSAAVLYTVWPLGELPQNTEIFRLLPLDEG